MKRSHHFSLFLITFLLTLLMLPFFVKAQVTVTVDGKAVDFSTLVVNITTVPEPPVDPPPIDPPPIDPPPIDPPPIDPPVGCGAVPPNGVGQSWTSLFQVAVPGPKNKQVVVTIPPTGYRAVSFNTGNVSDSGAIRNFEAAASVGARVIAISECVGDFDVAPICKKVVGTYQESVIWSTRNLAGYCNLKSNTTYYWNTKFANPCTSAYCNTTLRASNSDYR